MSIVTDRRVLVCKGIVNRKEQSFPYSRINDAAYVRKGLYALTVRIGFDPSGSRPRGAGGAPVSPAGQAVHGGDPVPELSLGPGAERA